MNWHASAFHFPANFLEIILLLSPAILAPLREVHFSAPLVDVVDDEPGDGRDVAVPGPARLVGMAIVAGAIQDCCRFRRELRVGLKREGLVNGRISPRRTDELHARKNNCEHDSRPLQNL